MAEALTPEQWAEAQAPSLDDFELIARKAFEDLPAEFRQLIDGVPFVVAEFPDDETIAELEADSPFDLLGLFRGIGMAHDSDMPQTGQMPNQIWLYRRPILDYWSEHEETLGHIIRHVLIHEIGHHFGFSDDDMEALEATAD